MSKIKSCAPESNTTASLSSSSQPFVSSSAPALIVPPDSLVILWPVEFNCIALSVVPNIVFELVIVAEAPLTLTAKIGDWIVPLLIRIKVSPWDFIPLLSPVSITWIIPEVLLVIVVSSPCERIAIEPPLASIVPELV